MREPDTSLMRLDIEGDLEKETQRCVVGLTRGPPWRDPSRRQLLGALQLRYPVSR
ncbi:hypothetical protein [Mycobacteroides abscessus]|uniref:hypothetical protein n=1 Tax=Mycobacteroides abscessus TaxID=36809 RepID=UPI0012FFD871|nr:hypothetical protein [Mycobacteroides abscessus]